MLNEWFPIICLDCKQFPLITYNHSNDLLLKCPCGKNKQILLNNYIKQLKTIKEAIPFNNKCTYHNNNSFEYYCLKCKHHLCKLCNEKHNNQHQIINLTIPINTITIQEDLNIYINNINNSLLQYRNQQINYYLNQINEIEYLYKKKYNQIQSYCLLIQSIIYTYTQYRYNYNCILNILNNCFFDKSNITTFDNNTFKEYCNSIQMIYNNNIFKYELSNILLTINNKQINNGQITLFTTEKNHIIYYGEIKNNNKKDGYGIFYYSNGDIEYEGQWKDDKVDGYGIYYCSNGNKYEGQLKDDKSDGYGILYYSNGDIAYEGQWKDDKFDGYGIYYYLNGK